MGVSIVQYYGEQTGKCGYCKGTNCSKSHGMNAASLTCEDYQDLIDRGWRRCGNYCYKPQNDATCCPCYTIKCDTLEFKLSKSHKRVLKRMNRFLRDGKREAAEQQQQLSNGDDGDGNMREQQPQIPDKAPLVINVDEVTSMATAVQSKAAKPPADTLPTLPATEISAIISESDAASHKPATVSNPPRKKAKQMRLERRQSKLGTNAALDPPKAVTQEKSLRDFLASNSDDDKHKLKLRMVQVAGEEFKRTLPQSFELYRKYQISIHDDPPKNRQAYLDHLQVTPLKHQKPRDGPDMGYGAFHQQYWLDDKLIAVGVIDILPSSVSSVYFFYDPDYSFLSLGTYGSLREIDLVQTLAAQVPALKYYYMGFYIHSCPKMRYKGKLSASYLLCPETYAWLPFTDAIRAKLDADKYQRLNTDAAARDTNEFLRQHLNDVLLLIDSSTFTSYGRFVELAGPYGDRDEVVEYAQLVGKVCAHRMLYFANL